ncbi:hypothetical protein GOBAR_AA10678 [Gossypium barbadense]|uniref:non-specific serine/threonine protein kinase n=1 Tax=Gossypium barbadense TaxID=3634 RepID=A0A2P5Y308_GOSBA|nr:hypothetical protein GOBAR_AA10678 [Gossypium barbadense]
METSNKPFVASKPHTPVSSNLKADTSVSSSLKSFSFSDLKNATKNFRSETLLGEGGFGCAFKGWIDEHMFAPTKPGTGIVVAIKKLKLESFQGHKEWLAEVNYLGQLRHENLVKLIGYCVEFENRLLRVFNQFLGLTRMHIARQVAQGLTFLHSLDANVIFRDLKASNILLDSDYNAKLSDFGLARDGPTGDNTHVSTRVVGTQGYAAPEYVATVVAELSVAMSCWHQYGGHKWSLSTTSPAYDMYKRPRIEHNMLSMIIPAQCCGARTTTRLAEFFYGNISLEFLGQGHLDCHLTPKSDVYSFGVVLLELLSGRRAVDDENFGFSEETLEEWAKPFLSDNRKVLRIMDTRLGGQYSKKGAQAAAALALQCLHKDPKNRPCMTDVLASLERLHVTKDSSARTPQQLQTKLDHHGIKHVNSPHKARIPTTNSL